ncbi:MAG: hypothetical protein NTW90_07575 [Nitrosospira sp.]|nr:hypothetical protein [Nitrosospira sp.]
MGTETVGIRRLYDALGCSVDDGQDICVSGLLPNGKQARLYIGPNPPLGILALESEQYGIPGRQTNLLHVNSEYKSDCFLEISITFEYEADEVLSRGIQNKDQGAREALLQIAKEHSQLFEKLIDAISGIIGLRFHRQLVLKQLVENVFISSGPEPVSSYTGGSVEMLEPIKVQISAQSSLREHIAALEFISEETLTKGGAIFHWLLKAWREQDQIAKFVYLFIPLEAILPSDIEVPNNIENNLISLSELIRASSAEDKESLLRFLEITKTKYGSTLNARFEEFARNAAIPGWEADVAAFKKYNRMRNLLVHAGCRDIHTQLTIEEETRTLEDLVERYIGIALLESHDVYASPWRPSRVAVGYSPSLENQNI